MYASSMGHYSKRGLETGAARGGRTEQAVSPDADARPPSSCHLLTMTPISLSMSGAPRHEGKRFQRVVAIGILCTLAGLHALLRRGMTHAAHAEPLLRASSPIPGDEGAIYLSHCNFSGRSCPGGLHVSSPRCARRIGCGRLRPSSSWHRGAWQGSFSGSMARDVPRSSRVSSRGT